MDPSIDIDLGAILAPLSREQLELIVVKMIGKYPQEWEMIEKMSRSEVTTTNQNKCKTSNTLKHATTLHIVCLQPNV